MPPELMSIGSSLLSGLLGGSSGGSGGGGQSQATAVNTSNTNTSSPNIILGSDVGALTQTGTPSATVPSLASSYLPTLGSSVATNSASTPAISGSTGLSTTQIVMIAAGAAGVLLLVSTLSKRRSASLSYAPTATA